MHSITIVHMLSIYLAVRSQLGRSTCGHGSTAVAGDSWSCRQSLMFWLTARTASICVASDIASPALEPSRHVGIVLTMSFVHGQKLTSRTLAADKVVCAPTCARVGESDALPIKCAIRVDRERCHAPFVTSMLTSYLTCFIYTRQQQRP